MTATSAVLSNISPFGLAFDVLAPRPIPKAIVEPVYDVARDILNDKIFLRNYTEVINMVVQAEYKKRPNLSLRQKVLIKEQISSTAQKNLNTLVLNTALKYIKIQLRSN